MDQIVIGGAGPTGLSAALFLKQKGLSPRIIEKDKTRSAYSKALAVNARSLELLEGTGATEAFLKNGRKFKKLNIWKNEKKMFGFDISKQGGKYPFVIIQPQSESEQIIEKLLKKKKIVVERGHEIEDLTAKEKSVELKLQNNPKTLKTKHYFAAEGAHSVSRKALEIPFEGLKIKHTWYLYDMELDIPLAKDEGHAFFLEDGVMLFIRIDKKVWRVISSMPGVLDRLPKGTDKGSIIWQSHFGVSSRLIERFKHRHVFFGGDAAHIHSPAGGRGMNLGIEDAYVFAELYAKGQLDRYSNLRKPIVARTMKRIEKLTTTAQGGTLMAKTFRFSLPVLGLLTPFVGKSMTRFFRGLDHELKL
jgi:2-polyprenyl-6-methoxyphenol hydroxylase-like FAD-dependent oxidoreductase